MGADADRTRRIFHMHCDATIVGLDFDRGMRKRSGRAADQKRNLETQALHFFRHMRHLFQRGRDQTGEADDVGFLVNRGLQNFGGGHHYAEVDHVVVIALQHHADDVFADVVHIALDCGHDDLATGLRDFAAAQFFFFDIGHEVGHGLLHHARRFHYLRQKHLARAEQIAHHIHAIH